MISIKNIVIGLSCAGLTLASDHAFPTTNSMLQDTPDPNLLAKKSEKPSSTIALPSGSGNTNELKSSGLDNKHDADATKPQFSEYNGLLDTSPSLSGQLIANPGSLSTPLGLGQPQASLSVQTDTTDQSPLTGQTSQPLSAQTGQPPFTSQTGLSDQTGLTPSGQSGPPGSLDTSGILTGQQPPLLRQGDPSSPTFTASATSSTPTPSTPAADACSVKNTIGCFIHFRRCKKMQGHCVERSETK